MSEFCRSLRHIALATAIGIGASACSHSKAPSAHKSPNSTTTVPLMDTAQLAADQALQQVRNDFDTTGTVNYLPDVCLTWPTDNGTTVVENPIVISKHYASAQLVMFTFVNTLLSHLQQPNAHRSDVVLMNGPMSYIPFSGVAMIKEPLTAYAKTSPQTETADAVVEPSRVDWPLVDYHTQQPLDKTEVISGTPTAQQLSSFCGFHINSAGASNLN